MAVQAPVSPRPNVAQPSAADSRDRFTYRGEALRALTLPLGGIGAGNVSLAGDGGLRQWQIANNVNHDAHLPGTFFAVWASHHRFVRNNAVVLQSSALYDDADFSPSPSVSDHLVPKASRALLAELPGVDALTITARHPIAEVTYESKRIPVQVSLEAFSPFIPLNSKDSGMPVVIFNFSVHNPTATELHVSLMATQQNPVGWDGKSPIHGTNTLGYGGNVNSLVRLHGLDAILMTNTRLEALHPANGQVALAVMPQRGDLVTNLLRWSDPSEPWNYFVNNFGRLPSQTSSPASFEGQTWNAALANSFLLHAGETRTVTFLLAWHFPNRYVAAVHDLEMYEMGVGDRKSRFWLGNDYANRFGSALAVLETVRDNHDRLCEQTRRFHDRLYDSTLPWSVVESASVTASTLHSPTVLWTEDGRFHGYEGCHGASTRHGAMDGSCPMDCTHVWNYEMALSKLFPDLEQLMRVTDLVDQISPWGSIPHRTVLPLYLPRAWDDFIGGPRNPAMDGELGTVLKTYREVRQGAPRVWFDELWPAVKRVMAHVMKDYDSENDGVIRGEQPNTYDISIYGPNTFIGSLYLAALRAAEEMARLQEDEELAGTFHARYELGRTNYDKLCWNGEYYVQVVDMTKHVEMQFGDGCHIDQLLGQWWAFNLDLGYVLPEAHVQTTLRNIYANNRRLTFLRVEQSPRIYLDERDRGLYICTWPHGGKPEQPTLYSDEIWTGLEYPLAAMLLHIGESEAALTMLEDIRDRHDGTRRSPWNEVECGDHYARAMASWTVLEEAAGTVYNAPAASLRIAPRLGASGSFRSFFITGSGWGTLHLDGKLAGVIIEDGALRLSTVTLPAQGQVSTVTCGSAVPFSSEEHDGLFTLHFTQPVTITPNTPLMVAFQ